MADNGKPSPKKKSPSVQSLLFRYHAVLFTVTILGGLAVGVFMLNQAISSSDDAQGYTPQLTDTSFDTATIKKLEGLTPPGEMPPTLNLPEGRVDPFKQ
jgi:hypothetical protein